MRITEDDPSMQPALDAMHEKLLQAACHAEAVWIRRIKDIGRNLMESTLIEECELRAAAATELLYGWAWAVCCSFHLG